MTPDKTKKTKFQPIIVQMKGSWRENRKDLSQPDSPRFVVSLGRQRLAPLPGAVDKYTAAPVRFSWNPEYALRSLGAVNAVMSRYAGQHYLHDVARCVEAHLYSQALEDHNYYPARSDQVIQNISKNASEIIQRFDAAYPKKIADDVRNKTVRCYAQLFNPSLQ